MTPRERVIASLIGGALGLVVLYQAVNRIFLLPHEEATKQIANLGSTISKYQKDIDKAKTLRESWNGLVGRTLSRDRTIAANRFDEFLKVLVAKHQLQNATFGQPAGGPIGANTGISAVSFALSASGKYDDVLEFLHELYRAPFLCRVNKLGISAPDPKQPLNMVRLDLTVETPVMPALTRDEAKRLEIREETKPMDEAASPPTDPARPELGTDTPYIALADRNVFRPYVPPPNNLVTIDNQDWKDVVVRVAPYWEEKPYGEQPVLTVPSKSRRDAPAIQGDAVEVKVVYADGETFGPRRFDANTRPPWVLTVPVHHPAPPPETIALRVNNQDDDVVDLNVTVTEKGGQQRVLPTMRFPASSQHDVWTFKDAQSVAVSATYASGKPGPSQTYQPSASDAQFVVPPEPVEAVAQTNTPPAALEDAPADQNMVVTGMIVAPEVHELIAVNATTRTRVVYESGQAVDGGKLLAVHPLGGIVLMGDTGHYYLYPFGQAFTQRVLLEGLAPEASEEEIGATINAWSRGEPMVRAEAPGEPEGAIEGTDHGG